MIVGQKFRSGRDRQGKGDSMTQEEIAKVGVKKSSYSSEKREQERETYVTLKVLAHSNARARLN